jgi:hypothetical protein
MTMPRYRYQTGVESRGLATLDSPGSIYLAESRANRIDLRPVYRSLLAELTRGRKPSNPRESVRVANNTSLVRRYSASNPHGDAIALDAALFAESVTS